MSIVNSLKKIYNKSKLDKLNLAALKNEFNTFNDLDTNKRLTNNWDDKCPCQSDATEETNFDAHYVYHPAWAARIVKEINPEVHIDISSTLHFCSILSAFIPVDFYDFRPADLKLDNLRSLKADLNNLSFQSNSIHSISCMHTIEHIGLGRYGDPIDPEGDVKAINELKRVVAVDGHLLFVVPVGKPKIMFNAHRIYDAEMIAELFNEFELKNFSLITDNNKFINSASFEQAREQIYGCGCFWFVKKEN